MTLGLFFSRGVSLQLWLDKGILDREKLLYEEHLKQKNISKVYWFTYGSDDKKLAAHLKENNNLHQNIHIFPMPSLFNLPKIGTYLYSLFLPFIYAKPLLECDIYKTNQTDGSWSAVIAKKLYKKKLFYRTGFTISQLENNLKRFNILIRKSIELAEKFAYKNCDIATVSSQHNMEYVTNMFNILPNKLMTVYNFIDRNKFFDFKSTRQNKIIFIGRLSEEKNIFNLIVASHDANLELDIYGSGPLKNSLKNFIEKNNYHVSLNDNISNDKIPYILNKAKYFALVSKHEGMPKALLEGMAAGCICIGTNVSGINEVITNLTTGILADDISVESISTALNKAIEMDDHTIIQLKRNASQYIDNNFTLNSIIQEEKKILYRLLND